jgi:hypothetical protein
MDKRKRYRHLQAISIVMAVLMAASNIAFLVALALEAFDHQGGNRRGSSSAFPASDMIWPVIGSMLIVALAVLVVLPLRFYARGAVRMLGAVCSGFLIAGGLALAAVFAYVWLFTYWLGGRPPVFSLPLVVVAVLSLFGAAIVLIMKSRAGEREA